MPCHDEPFLDVCCAVEQFGHVPPGFSGGDRFHIWLLSAFLGRFLSAEDWKQMHVLHETTVMPRRLFLLVLGSLVASANAADGQEPDRPFSIAGSRVVAYSSEAVGAEFELHIASNSISERTADLPLVILLDSNQDFPLVTAVSRRLFGAGDLPDFLLVGVGYPEYPLYYRSRDYTPSADPDSELPSGGAHAFVRFLHAELIPWVEAEYGTSPYRVLVGHSLGGLLAVYAVTSTPGVFSGIVASSPAVWWGEEEVLERLKPGPWSKGLALYTSLGSEETELMRTSWSRLRELLPDLSSELRQRAELFSDEGHSSVKPIAYSRGLRWVFGTSARSQDPVNALGSNAVRLHQAP